MRTTFFATAAIVLLASLPLHAQECADEVLFETPDGSIVMRHVEALFNCCAGLTVEVTQEDHEIGIFEREYYEIGPCYCLCCFEVEASVSGLAPGDYSVSVWKVHDNCDGTWTYELVGTWVVPVSGYSAPSVQTAYLPCVTSGAEDETSTWGTIKALYRQEGRR